jgi:hypothetical protein
MKTAIVLFFLMTDGIKVEFVFFRGGPFKDVWTPRRSYFLMLPNLRINSVFATSVIRCGTEFVVES